MDLEAYFRRIGYAGDPRPDVATLCELHRAHLMAIPYENLDVQLGRPLDLDPAAAFEKLVVRRRGGWCYEMNGLFAAVLEAIGFNVTHLAGAVMREVMGDLVIGNHLLIRVDLDGPWIADVGFGEGSIDPYPMSRRGFKAGGFDFRLEALGEGWWRFHNHDRGGVRSYDFMLTPANPRLLAAHSDWQQLAPESAFVQSVVVQRMRPGEVVQLRGRMLRYVRPDGLDERALTSADEFVAILGTEFGIHLPEAASLWPRICARHEQLFAKDAAAA